MLNVYLFIDRAQGLLPAAGHRPADRRHPGRPEHLVPDRCSEKLPQFVEHRAQRPGGRERRRLHRRRRQTNCGFVFVALKPLVAAQASAADQVIARLRPQARRRSPARSLFLQPVQDIRVGGRQSNAQYQYTLQADDLRRAATTWAPKLTEALQHAAGARPTSTPTSSRTGWRPIVDDRPRHGRAARPHAAPDRQHALRRLRPAPGLDDLQRAEPVSRGHGGGAAVLAETRTTLNDIYVSTAGGAVERHAAHQRGRRHRRPRHERRARRRPRPHGRRRRRAQPGARTRSPTRGTRQRLDRRRRSARRRRPWCRSPPFAHFEPRQHAARGQPPGPVRRHHDLVQPARPASR